MERGGRDKQEPAAEGGPPLVLRFSAIVQHLFRGYLCGKRIKEKSNTMRIMTYWVAGALLGLAGCSTEQQTPANELTGNDFEHLTGWVPDNPSLTTEHAHSGKYAIKTDANIEYSLAYSRLLGQVSPVRLAKVRLTAYAYATKPGSGAVLTVQIVRSALDGANVFNQGIDLAKAVSKAGEWTKVSQEFELPAGIAPTNIMKVYLWRAAANAPVYVDDLSLEVL